jgi:hypothetical protein
MHETGRPERLLRGGKLPSAMSPADARFAPKAAIGLLRKSGRADHLANREGARQVMRRRLTSALKSYGTQAMQSGQRSDSSQ